MVRPLEKLLVPLRASAFLGGTAALYAAWEARLALASPLQREAVRGRWIARYGRAMLRLYGVQVHREGLPEDRLLAGTDARGVGRLFVLPHRSGFDIGLVLAHLDARLLSRGDLAGWPILGRAARRAGTLFVDRSSARSGATVVRSMVRALEAGQGIAVFPEGTTFSDDELRPFKAGAFLAAARAGAEVVPLGVAYAGAGAAFGDESFGAHLARVSAIPTTHVGLVVGEVLPPPHEDAVALTAAARAVMARAVARARALVEAEQHGRSR